MWEVEYTNEFEEWWNKLDEGEQTDIAACVTLLEICGPNLKFPHSSAMNGSAHSHMRELRIQHAGQPYRVLYAFDPRRTAILLVGGNKKGHNRWYSKFIPIADKLYEEHLANLRQEGQIDE
jgi:hypothetical protein